MNKYYLIAFTLLFPFALKAQTPEMNLIDTTKLDEVVVSSSRFPEKKQLLPNQFK